MNQYVLGRVVVWHSFGFDVFASHATLPLAMVSSCALREYASSNIYNTALLVSCGVDF